MCSQQYLYNAIGGVGDLMREGRAEPCPYGVGMQKNRPYQLDIYTVSFHAIPRQAREQDSFDTPS